MASNPWQISNVSAQKRLESLYPAPQTTVPAKTAGSALKPTRKIAKQYLKLQGAAEGLTSVINSFNGSEFARLIDAGNIGAINHEDYNLDGFNAWLALIANKLTSTIDLWTSIHEKGWRRIFVSNLEKKIADIEVAISRDQADDIQDPTVQDAVRELKTLLEIEKKKYKMAKKNKKERLNATTASVASHARSHIAGAESEDLGMADADDDAHQGDEGVY